MKKEVPLNILTEAEKISCSIESISEYQCPRHIMNPGLWFGFVIGALKNNEKNLALEIKLRDQEESIKILKTRVEGMILALKQHGQNIDPQFLIDWLEESLKKDQK